MAVWHLGFLLLMTAGFDTMFKWLAVDDSFRVGRLSFFRHLLALIGLTGIGFLITLIAGWLHPVLGILTLVGLVVTAVVFQTILLVKRLHDMNRSGWWAVFSFVPILSLALLAVALFVPGTDGQNSYGAPEYETGELPAFLSEEARRPARRM